MAQIPNVYSAWSDKLSGYQVFISLEITVTKHIGVPYEDNSNLSTDAAEYLSQQHP